MPIRQRPRGAARGSLPAAVAACAALALGPVGAQPGAQAERPDFTGVWTWNLSAGENPVQTLRAQAQDLPYTVAARARVEEYQEMARLSLENPGSCEACQ